MGLDGSPSVSLPLSEMTCANLPLLPTPPALPVAASFPANVTPKVIPPPKTLRSPAPPAPPAPSAPPTYVAPKVIAPPKTPGSPAPPAPPASSAPPTTPAPPAPPVHQKAPRLRGSVALELDAERHDPVSDSVQAFGNATQPKQVYRRSGGYGSYGKTVVRQAIPADAILHLAKRKKKVPESLYERLDKPGYSNGVAELSGNVRQAIPTGAALQLAKRKKELEEKLQDRFSKPGDVPLFLPEACGRPYDWNNVVQPLYWGRRAKKKKGLISEDAKVDVDKVMRFLQIRLDSKGRPVRERIGPPELQSTGWYRCAWLDYDACTLQASVNRNHDWQPAWHGCKFEALYSIIYHGELAESASAERGDRFLRGTPGVYCHGMATAQKAENYTRFVPLFGDGVYWSAKWEVMVDRADKVPTLHKDQWVQHARSVRLVALWLLGIRGQDLESGMELQAQWDPLLEANPKHGLIFAEPIPRPEIWCGMRFYCPVTEIMTTTAGQMREHMKSDMYMRMAKASSTWDGSVEKQDLLESLEEADRGYGFGAGAVVNDSSESETGAESDDSDSYDYDESESDVGACWNDSAHVASSVPRNTNKGRHGGGERNLSYDTRNNCGGSRNLMRNSR